MKYETLDHNKVLDMLPIRPKDAHKGSFGKILLLCSSRGYTGAAALAAMGMMCNELRLPLVASQQKTYDLMVETIKDLKLL